MPTLYTPAFWLACAIHFTGAMSIAMFLLFPLFIRALGGNELTIGLVLGVGLAVSVVVRPAVGGLLDHFGRRRVLLWGAALNAASCPLFLALESTGAWLFALSALHMIVGGALFAAYFTYASDLVPPARRTEGIAIFGTAGMLPNGLGPMLAETVVARAGYPGFFLVAMGFALVSLALTALVRERGLVPASTSTGFGGVGLRTIGRALVRGRVVRILVATWLFGVGVTAAFFFVAPYAHDLALPRSGPFFAAYAATAVALRIVGRDLLDRVARERLAVPAFGCYALGLVAVCLLPRAGVLVFAGAACGAGQGILFPVLNGLTIERTPPAIHGVVVSVWTAAMDLGTVVGAPILGAVAWWAGYPAMFLLGSLAALAGLVLMASDPGDP